MRLRSLTLSTPDSDLTQPLSRANVKGFDCPGIQADADQWWILPQPTGVSEAAKAPFPIGQVMQEGTALQAYIGGHWQWYYAMRQDLYTEYTENWPDYVEQYSYKWEEQYQPGDGSDPYGSSVSMWATWPSDRRSQIYAISSRGPTLDLRS